MCGVTHKAAEGVPEKIEVTAGGSPTESVDSRTGDMKQHLLYIDANNL